MGGKTGHKGFTIAEVLVVIVVIAILASMTVVGYRGMRLRATQAVVYDNLQSVSEQLAYLSLSKPDTFNTLTGLPGNLEHSEDGDEDVILSYNPVAGEVYKDLTPVQNGVLFNTICEELIADSFYATIHAKEGDQTQSVVMRCDDNTQGGGMQITGWDPRYWSTPVTVAALESYIDSVPYDNWWTDRQAVVRGFYEELIRRFQQKGGTFPVTSFWDTWANEWSGVPKEELPPLSTTRSTDGSFCIEAYHRDFPDKIYRIDQNGDIEEGSCP